jgi:N6-adenosine-specific RNA methylase IME4
MMAWGFEYKTCACWDKGGEHGTHAGMGSYYRQQHELLFVGTRGNMPPPAPANRPPSILRAPRGRHSSKPDIARQQIEAMYGEGIPRIELFARGPVPNWSVWGFEAEEGKVGKKREA